MDPSGHNRWLRAVLLLGVVYLVIGIAFAKLANSSASHEMVVTWRLAAFVASAAVFAAHIGHEHFRLHNPPRTTAWHTAMAVAIGAFALALAANLHTYVTGSGNHGALALALVAWPLLCGLPAFVVALVAARGFTLFRRSS